MTSLRRLLLLAFLTAALSGCGESGIYAATVVADGTHAVRARETVRGVLVSAGGRTRIAPGARIAGGVYVLGGDVEVSGAVVGDVTIVGGRLALRPGAELSGRLRVGGGTVVRDPAAIVHGGVETGARVAVPTEPGRPTRWLAGEQVGWRLAQALLLAGLAALITRFRPRPLSRMADALAGHGLVAGALGALAGFVGLSLLVLMAFTVVLIPVSLLGLVLAGATVVLGWLAWGAVCGRLVVRHLKLRWRPSTAAFWGTVGFMLALEGIGALPVIGGTVALILTATGLGAVVLTRWGLRTYVPETVA